MRRAFEELDPRFVLLQFAARRLRECGGFGEFGIAPSKRDGRHWRSVLENDLSAERESE